ncbi:MAG TPA: putative sulfate exporter family transporter [Longimicrobium sp.]|nr:putative sulfate exporter family transporter [Longimicrobium sp.]
MKASGQVIEVVDVSEPVYPDEERSDQPGGAGEDAPAPLALRLLFVALAACMLMPWASAAVALAAGAAFALTLGNPFPKRTAAASKWLLQGSVVALGFGMPLVVVLRAGAAGVGYTVAGIATALVLGAWLGRWLGVPGETSFLVTSGTAICGGSAIAAVGRAINAPAEAMSVSLATVFVLNAVALYLFPPIGHLVGLSQAQFAVWAAVAIHDTSSVVGAASAYGARALEMATVLKLARALWIVPLALAAAAWHRRRIGAAGGEGSARIQLPWFIGLFLLAAVARSLLPAAAEPVLDLLARAGRIGLVLTLFLIGAGLTRATLRAVGTRPLVHGFVLWVVMGGLALLAIWRWVPA